jgi:hypothetical protein
MVFKSVEICRSLYLVESYSVGVDCLEAVCELRLTYLGFCSTGVCQFLTQGAVCWSLMGRSLLIRDRKLVSNDISVGRVAVFFGGRKLKSVFSKNGIKSGPLLGSVCFSNFFGVRLYTTPLFVAPLLRVSVRLVQRLVY